MDVVTLALAKKGAKEYTDSVIAQLPNGLVYKGGVENYAALPASGQTEGDCYSTLDTGKEYAWGKVSGTAQWIELGADLTDYIKNTDYAYLNHAGVVKAYSDYCFLVDGSGLPYTPTKTYAQYNNLTGISFIGKGTLENVITGKGILTSSNYTTTSLVFTDEDGNTTTVNAFTSVE